MRILTEISELLHDVAAGAPVDPNRALRLAFRLGALDQRLDEALLKALASIRELRGLAFTGSRIPTDRYPEKGRAIQADAWIREIVHDLNG